MFRYLKRLLPTRPWISVVVERPSPRPESFSTVQPLPKLPIPPLCQTLRKYLDTCRPLLTDEQYKRTEEIVARFLKDEGPILQNLLEDKARKDITWLSKEWINATFLENRDPVMINVNPGMCLPKQNYRGQQEQIEFAARLITGVLEYKIMLDELRCCFFILIVQENTYSRHKHLLLPFTEITALRHHFSKLFAVDVYGDKGKPLSLPQLSQQLSSCIHASEKPGVPVGILTSLERTTWAKTYAIMLKDTKNRASFESIQSSIFVLCLDGPYPVAEGVSPIDLAASIFLHGGGSHVYSTNRWFDKSLQLYTLLETLLKFILSPDGYVGLNSEHTVAEGPAIIGLIEHVLGFLEQNQVQWMASSSMKPPQKLHFTITSQIQEVINLALAEADLALLADVLVYLMASINSAVNNLMLRGLFFKDYGKSFIKSYKLSPDAFIQMALQLAYYRIHRHPCATYEAGSLRQFQLGRSDTIHSCSMASVAFTKGMDDPSISPTMKVNLLKVAVDSHRKHTDDVVNGHGIDRHLLALKIVASESGMETPELFLDLAFKESTYFRMLTSQIFSNYRTLVCIGPDEQDGYGLSYNPHDNELIVSITSFRKCPETDSDKFLTSFSQSLLDMKTLIMTHCHPK